MSLSFFYFLNILLFARLIFQFKDQALTKQNLYRMSAFELLGMLVFIWNLWLFVLAILIIVFNSLNYFLEIKSKKLNLDRLFFLLIFFITFSFFFSKRFNIEFNMGLFKTISGLDEMNLIVKFFKTVDLENFNVILTGFLLCMNEINCLIRFILEKLDIAPKIKQKEVIDESEYNAGRIIGILERIIIYFLVITGNYTAIGIVLAAKGFTRFKELENRAFAEYVLIGTLLSTVFAGGVALLISKFL